MSKSITFRCDLDTYEKLHELVKANPEGQRWYTKQNQSKTIIFAIKEAHSKYCKE